MASHTHWFPVIAIALACSAAAAGEATGDYATDLATVYSGYQRLLAMREACDAALPESRAANAQAFSVWRSKHGALIDELRRRVNTMIRLASRDEKDYAHNLGKYEGAIVQERQEYRQRLLAVEASALRERCQRLPELLKGPDADLGKVYAAELETIHRRKP
jgi:Ser/Thr protein kinase RdoA (MazF antagonist)